MGNHSMYAKLRKSTISLESGASWQSSQIWVKQDSGAFKAFGDFSKSEMWHSLNFFFQQGARPPYDEYKGNDSMFVFLFALFLWVP